MSFITAKTLQILCPFKLCVCVPVCMFRCTCLNIHICGGQRSMLDVIAQVWFTFLGGMIFHLDLHDVLMRLGCLAHEPQGLLISASNTGLEMCLITSGFFCGFWGFNSTPHVFTAATFPARPCSSPLSI